MNGTIYDRYVRARDDAAALRLRLFRMRIAAGLWCAVALTLAAVLLVGCDTPAAPTCADWLPCYEACKLEPPRDPRADAFPHWPTVQACAVSCPGGGILADAVIGADLAADGGPDLDLAVEGMHQARAYCGADR